MGPGIIGKKLGMVQVFEKDGASSAATVIEAGPCVVVQKKTEDGEGYNALQLGFGEGRKKTNSPISGHFKKNGLGVKRALREFRDCDVGSYNIGDEIKVDIFAPGDYVDVSGVSKGAGFAGVMKRWGFGGAASASHGTHKVDRKAGSIGASATPARVLKGTRMAGRKGSASSVSQNLKVVRVDAAENLLFIKGAVAGPSGGYVLVNKAKKKR